MEYVKLHRYAFRVFVQVEGEVEVIEMSVNADTFESALEIIGKSTLSTRTLNIVPLNTALDNAVLNLTQHISTPEQGVDEPRESDKNRIRELLTFNELPSRDLIELRAKSLAEIANDLGYSRVMIGGAPFLMAPLETALTAVGIEFMYAFSVRRTHEKDGVKTSIFTHEGFV